MQAVTNEQLLAAVQALSTQVQKIASALDKQQQRREYQAAYYKKRKAAKAEKAKRIELPDGHCLECRRSDRIPKEAWAKQMRSFVERGLSPYNFLTWVAWSWNQSLFNHVPITKSGGYMHVFIGYSGKKALRCKFSERDVTGRMRISRFSRPEQLDTLGQALYWKWTFHTINKIVDCAEEQGWFETLSSNWQKVLKVAMGGFSCYEVKGEIWDPNERDFAVINKTYSQLRPTLDMSWNAFLRGLFSKEEPFSDQTQ